MGNVEKMGSGDSGNGGGTKGGGVAGSGAVSRSSRACDSGNTDSITAP